MNNENGKNDKEVKQLFACSEKRTIWLNNDKDSGVQGNR